MSNESNKSIAPNTSVNAMESTDLSTSEGASQPELPNVATETTNAGTASNTADSLETTEVNNEAETNGEFKQNASKKSAKYYNQQNVASRLNFSGESLTIAQNDAVIAARLALFNYGPDRLASGIQLHLNAESAETNVRVALGRQSAATKALNAILRDLRIKYGTDRRIVKELLKGNEEMYAELRLGVRLARKRQELLRQAKHFYEQVIANEEVASLFTTRYNLTPDVFEARQQDLTALEEAMRTQQVRIGEARKAAQVARATMRELDTWMSEFIGVARQAFRGDEAQLKKLGVQSKVSP